MNIFAELRSALKPMPFAEWLTHREAQIPNWDWRWPHLVLLQDRLEEVTRGDLRRLAISMPPRHGKTATVIRYVAHRLERNPSLRIVLACHTQRLATNFSRQIRRLCEARGVQLDTDAWSAEDWNTHMGGGIRAVGSGAAVHGVGADLLVVDDPTASREAVESQDQRDKAGDWWSGDLLSRLEPDGAALLIGTRFHADDLFGRVLVANEEAERWESINLPALSEGEGDALGRPEGEALSPHYTRERLEKLKAEMGSWAFTALFQGRPVPRDAGIFRRSWFPIVDERPTLVSSRVRYWDLAGTFGGGDWTVGARVSKTPLGMFFVENVVRGRWAGAERDRIIKRTVEADGSGVSQWFPQDPGSAGKDVAGALIRLLAGFSVRAEPVTGTKAIRAGPFAAQAEAGNVRLVRGDWNTAFLDEIELFPGGKHDDQVDAVSGAFAKSARRELVFAIF